MRRSLFTMGFSSPVQGYGAVQTGPGLGLSLTDVGNFFKGISTPTPAAAPAALPPAPSTILGMDQTTFMVGGAALLVVGLVVAVVAGRKSAAAKAVKAKK